jgi:hypothetical protein
MYRTCTWESERKKLSYTPRRAEHTALYQIAYSYRDELEHCWDELFSNLYGPARPEMFTALDAYLNCGVYEHGVARVYCDHCTHSFIVPFSCKERLLCPSCNAKRAVLFAENLLEKVLEAVPHHHIVFSIPKRLRRFFLFDRSLFGELYHAAIATLEFCLEPPEHKLGAVLTLQTAGDDLGWNPHLHGILASGTFAPGGEVLPGDEINSALLTDTFARLLLKRLLNREVISQDDHDQILSQNHTGFSVWVGEPFTDADSKRFVARYIERSPISLKRLALDGDFAAYTTKDGTVHRFMPLEFLARLLQHTVRHYESITRYYGFYSSRARGDRKKLADGPTAATFSDLPEPSTPPSSSWQRGMKALFEIDPLVCTECQTQMRIISFIFDPAEIKKIMNSLDIPPYRAPPKLKPHPIQQSFDLYIDDTYDTCD